MEKALPDLLLDAEATRLELVEFIRREVNSAGFTRAVLGLSGGVDSAVAAFLAAEALETGNLLAAILPYRTSSHESHRDAQSVCRQLNTRSETVDISPMVDAYLQHAGDVDPVRKGNIMARQRMIVLYDLSARENALVLGTSNKTEILLGYGTLFGDTACAINPLGDLYKTQVWQLAEAIGVPRTIIDKKPTADLWPGQTDEGELGFSYRRVDQLLHYLIDKKIDVDELELLGFEREFTVKVQAMIHRNEFKSRPPVIAKLSRARMAGRT